MNTKKQSGIIELQKEAMHFSAGHFTIFSETEREPFHGHNYQVGVALHTWIDEKGLSFDYRFYKQHLQMLCKKLHQTFLIPGKSPYLTWKEENGYVWFSFNNEKIPFLPSDITILPISNITVEELSKWFIQELLKDAKQLQEHRIHKIVVKIFSGPGQSGSTSWEE
jgi:6-pyruvoyltetrahydropterin/6-carboxytetrahydropterin synthase